MIKTKQIEGLHKVLSCGGLDVPTISVGLTGLLNVGSGTFIINSSSDFSSAFKEVTVAPLVNYQLTANTYYYVVVDWNGGSPQYQVITNNNTINHSNILSVYNVYWENVGLINEAHYFHVGKYGYGLSNKIAHRIIHTQRFGVESGFALGEAGTRNITITAGKVWYDGEEIDLLAVDTSIDNYHLYYHSAPNVWTAETRAQYSNTEYDNNAGGLQTISNNKYSVSWVYRGISASDVYVVLGIGDYSQDQALVSQPPPLPDLIAKQAFLVGRIIVQKNDATAYKINSIFEVPFAVGGGVSDHNQLSNLQGGQPTEYYHLTNQQATGAVKKTITFVIDGGSNVPATGAYASIKVPFAGTISNWTIISDVSGSCVLDIWNLNGAKPTNANTITASAKPTLTASDLSTSGTLTGWTTAVAVGDILTVEIESISTAKRITLILEVDL